MHHHTIFAREAHDLSLALEAVGLDAADAPEPQRLQMILAAFFPHGVLWLRSDERRRQHFASMEGRQFALVYDTLKAAN